MHRFILVLAVLSLTSIFCISGSSGDLSDCIAVTVDVISPGQTVVDVSGTVQNECSEDASYAKVVATCYDASDSVIGRDEEYVENISAGESKTFEAIISDQGQETSKCSATVEEAR